MEFTQIAKLEKCEEDHFGQAENGVRTILSFSYYVLISPRQEFYLERNMHFINKILSKIV